MGEIEVVNERWTAGLVLASGRGGWLKVYVIVLATSLKSAILQRCCNLEERLQEVFKQRSVGSVQLCEVVPVDIR